MLKRIVVPALALLVSLNAALVFGAEEAKAQKNETTAAAEKAPRLTVVEPVKDFGTIPKGDKLDWTFLVKNTGNADLQILSARPSCGCTVADWDKVVKPGETGKVSAHVDTTNFTGPIAKAITIDTNDPSTPSAQLTIHAIVKPYVEAYPAGFVRFNLLQGDTDVQTVTLYSEESEPFEITKVESPEPWIKVDTRKIDDPTALVTGVGRQGQAQYRISITAGGPEAKIGPIANKVHIATNSKHTPDYYLTVSGVVRPPFRVEPSGVNFGEVTPNDTAATRSVVLRSNNIKAPETFVVSKAESDVPGVTAAVKPTANKGEYEVTLQVAPNAKPGDVTGDVKIYTNDKIAPVVTVPVKGTIKATSSK
ncbi:MAG TPA: DUF1573 domain-containing protein [Thermoanaerobaculia bacterium]|nr:DUF1573 domain-containing protein [Thermoanaerobaculia bacterium]